MSGRAELELLSEQDLFILTDYNQSFTMHVIYEMPLCQVW